MRKPTHVHNVKTGVKFPATKDLLNYASQEAETFKVIYGDEEEAPEKESFTEESLKAMNMKELQNLVESLELSCDKRRKEEMIDAILKNGR